MVWLSQSPERGSLGHTGAPGLQYLPQFFPTGPPRCLRRVSHLCHIKSGGLGDCHEDCPDYARTRPIAARQSGHRTALGPHPESVGPSGHHCAAVRGETLRSHVALHARRSFAAIACFRRLYPERPLIVALTGTDLYGDIRTSAEARESLELATRL